MKVSSFILFCTLVCSVCEGAPDARETRFTWAVVPQYSNTVTHERWAPFITELGRSLGIKVELLTYSDFHLFENDIKSGKPDFIYLNPFHALMARQAQNYEPIIRDGREKLTGILVVRRDSGLRTLEDLRGRRIAFAAPSAFGASLYLRSLLQTQYNIDFETVYVGSQSNAYRSTLLRRTASGGGVERTLAQENPQVRDGLRVIYRAPPATPHPVVIHPRLTPALRDAVVRFFLDTASGTKQHLLEAIQIPEPVKADYSRDYADLERIGLEKFIDER